MGKYTFLSRHFLEKNKRDVQETTQRASIFLAKTTCWYCNEQLDNSRRYCDKNCAAAFEEDESAMARRMHDNQLQMPT